MRSVPDQYPGSVTLSRSFFLSRCRGEIPSARRSTGYLTSFVLGTVCIIAAIVNREMSH